MRYTVNLLIWRLFRIALFLSSIKVCYHHFSLILTYFPILLSSSYRLFESVVILYFFNTRCYSLLSWKSYREILKLNERSAQWFTPKMVAMTRTRPGAAKNCSHVSYVGNRCPYTWTIFSCFFQTFNRKLDWGELPGYKLMPKSDAHASGGGFTSPQHLPLAVYLLHFTCWLIFQYHVCSWFPVLFHLRLKIYLVWFQCC